VPADPANSDDASGPKLPVLALRLLRSKTASPEEAERVLAIGRPAVALNAWHKAAGISEGPVFCAIDRWGAIGDCTLDGQSVNAIVKKRCALGGLDPADDSTHRLRSGYLTEPARRGVPLPETMRQSRHRSVQQAAAYYNEVEIERGAARLV
jgi:integrase